MNRYKKIKGCGIPEDLIAELAKEMTDQEMSFIEITRFINTRIKGNYSLEGILCILNARSYMVMEEQKYGKTGFKTYYRVVTKEYYEKIEKEHRENAKRRLLAAVSY